MKTPFAALAVALLPVAFPLACGLDGPVESEDPNESAQAGGTAATGGSGGAPSTGPTGGSAETPVEPSCDDPPHAIDPDTLELCPSEICGGGARCVPTALVVQNGGQEQADMLADCTADAKCVPDEFIETAGLFTPESCRSLLGAEGRCLSTCIPQVKEKNDAVGLPQDVCGEFEVCVPCYDPQTGETTGGCELSCDEGPVEEPVLLPSCCSDNGTCVPTGAVPPAQLENLGDYGCAEATGGDFICAPNVFVQDQSYSPPACYDLPFMLTLLLPGWAQEGRCLPDCLPALDDAPVALQQGACGAGSLCAPCWEPKLIGGPQPTGACDY